MTLSSALTTVQDKARQYINIVLAAVLLLVLLNLRSCFQAKPNPFALPHRTDTVRVAKRAQVKKIPAVEHWPAAIVTIYEKDTLARRQAEKDDIVLSGKIENQRVELTTISPSGEVKLFTFDIPEVPSIVTLDNGGISVVEDKRAKRRKTWKGIWSGVKIAAAGVAAGVVIGTVTK